MPAKKKADTKAKKTKKEEVAEEKTEEKKTKKTAKKTTAKKTTTKKTTAKKTKAEEKKDTKTTKAKEVKEKPVAEEVKDEDIKATEVSTDEVVTPKGNIVTIDSTARKTSIKAQEKKLWKEINNDVNQKRIIDGFVEGIETEPSMMIVSSYRNKRVIIPMSESGITLISDVTDEKEKKRRLERVITSMIGAPIQFVLAGVDEKNNMIAASRREAQNRTKARFYGGANPLIHKESVVEARVIAVKERSVRFEVFGYDQTIGIKDLTYEWISDAREKFYVGDIVPLLVEEVTYDNSKKAGSQEWCDSLDVKLNAKATQENRTLEAYEHTEIEGKYLGTVTNIKGNMYYIALANGANAVAQAHMTNPKTLRGDKVCFLCKSKQKSTHTLSGIIIRTIMSDFKG